MSATTLKSVRVEDGTTFIGATFLYLFFALLITVVVEFTAGAIMNNVLGSGYLVNGDLDAASQIFQTYIIILIASAISLIVFTIWIRLSLLKGGKGILIPFILYSVAMGILLSTFNLFLYWYEILAAFGITTVVFGVMALIGYFGGEKVKWFGLIGLGLLVGAFIIGLTSLIWYWLAPSFYNVTYTLVAGLMLIAVLFISSFDIYNMKKIAESGTGTPNLAMYCAFNLYVDFVYILIRILMLMMRNRR